MRIWLARDPHHPHAVTPERNNKMATTPLQRTIVFSHANSFPAHTYQMLFEHWQAQGYTVHAIEQYGHDPRYPVTADWPHLVAQLRDFIAREVGHPVFLVGHSLGGYLSLMLASQYPQWSQGVVVLDSPISCRKKTHPRMAQSGSSPASLRYQTSIRGFPPSHPGRLSPART